MTDYVALVNAIGNKDVEQITEIFDDNEDKLGKIYEAMDPKAMDQLRKISQKLPKVNTVTSTTNKTVASSPGQKGLSQDDDEIVSADADSGTIAVKDPKQQGKVEIKSIKDQQNIPEIENLLKNAGINV